MPIEESTVADALARLRRIEGQVGGIRRMIEDGRECSDVAAQIAAASKALDQVGLKLLVSGLRHCITDAEAAARAGYSEAELERLFLMLA